ncbi:hypothetical protein [Methylacidiphilum caldifontis]|uniref:Uncharacterized protein n=1 Tax=Methylacidiphilum caldifontis TaxID=2795386 RepID=A0A4Y8PBG9_9BACT|nr:hypothetical protein [Methylacidiphilum caldifontis]QSR89415.1 hypothetical protein IT6_03805 [Methylacidiphilum caldifontis]TFE66994.1 hypothetical protein A7Q10_01705 [Methylacidiphilum caldifontis]
MQKRLLVFSFAFCYFFLLLLFNGHSQSVGQEVCQFLATHYESLDITLGLPKSGKKEDEHYLLIKDKDNTFYLFSLQGNKFSLKAVAKDYAFLAAHKALKLFTDIHSRDEYARKASKFLGVDENIFVLEDSVE